MMTKRNMAVAGMAFAVMAAFAEGTRTGQHVFDVPANDDPPIWQRWDVGGAIDLSDADGVEFDFYCDNPTRFGNFFLRLYTSDDPRPFESGFHIRFQPEEIGKWCHIRLRKVDTTISRMRPCGSWANITSLCLIGEKGGGTGAARIKIANIKPIRPARIDAVVVFGESSIKREGSRQQLNGWSVGMTRRLQDALWMLGVPSVVMADLDVAKRGIPEGVKLVTFDMNHRASPEGMFEAVTNFAARGCKVLGVGGLPKALAGFLRAHPAAGVDVGQSLLKNDNYDVPAFSRRLEGVVTNLLPEVSSQAAAARAEAARAEERILAEIRAMPGRQGEMRILECHRAYGPWPEKEGWDEVARFAKDCGFTVLDVNVCTGPIAWYPSKVLRPAKEVAARGDSIEQLVKAARACGLKVSAWRCCFLQKTRDYPEIAEEIEKAGRLSVDSRLEPSPNFLCPVNPLNRGENVAALAEMAGKGVDVVNLDFIRYSSTGYCCCPTCRKAFEKEVGQTVANWPADLFKAEAEGGFEKRWRDFRAEVITSHIREIRAAVKAVNPKVELWSSCFPTVRGAYNSEGQDWVRWKREGLIDHLAPMNYSISPAGFESAILHQRDALGGALDNVGPSFGPVRWNGANTVAEKALYAAKHIELLRRHGFTTYGFFDLQESTKPIIEMLAQGPLGR